MCPIILFDEVNTYMYKYPMFAPRINNDTSIQSSYAVNMHMVYIKKQKKMFIQLYKKISKYTRRDLNPRSRSTRS